MLCFLTKLIKNPRNYDLLGFYLHIRYLLNYSPLNVLADCLKWKIPKYRVLLNSNGLGYPRSSYG
ncbi:hypothetical protein COL87_30735 [Bacillus pseudomycoides]|nr:hypothetical protein COL87_30735 [Bacillus pseudomycoides]